MKFHILYATNFISRHASFLDRKVSTTFHALTVPQTKDFLQTVANLFPNFTIIAQAGSIRRVVQVKKHQLGVNGRLGKCFESSESIKFYILYLVTLISRYVQKDYHACEHRRAGSIPALTLGVFFHILCVVNFLVLSVHHSQRRLTSGLHVKHASLIHM